MNSNRCEKGIFKGKNGGMMRMGDERGEYEGKKRGN